MGVKKIDCCTSTPKAKCFPKLMKNMRTGGIALFENDAIGTMLIPGLISNRSVGQSLGVRGTVVISHWEDYDEPLTLQNE